MPMSQIDMVVLIDGATLQVCGDFKPESGRPSKRPEVHVVVRQGDIVARGQRAVKEDLATWTVEVATDQQQQFTTASAIACAAIIVEKEPGGLEALSWVQEVTILKGERQDTNVPFDFPPSESVASPQGGQLPEQHAVSASLAILKTGDNTLSWHHEVNIRPVASAEVVRLSRSA